MQLERDWEMLYFGEGHVILSLEFLSYVLEQKLLKNVIPNEDWSAFVKHRIYIFFLNLDLYIASRAGIRVASFQRRRQKLRSCRIVIFQKDKSLLLQLLSRHLFSFYYPLHFLAIKYENIF